MIPGHILNQEIYSSLSLTITYFNQGYKARKVISEVTNLLYCSVLSLCGNVNTRRMSQPDMGPIFYIKKSMKYSGHRKLLCELSKLSKLNAFILLTLMHLFLYAEYTHYATANNFPRIITLPGHILNNFLF